MRSERHTHPLTLCCNPDENLMICLQLIILSNGRYRGRIFPSVVTPDDTLLAAGGELGGSVT